MTNIVERTEFKIEDRYESRGHFYWIRAGYTSKGDCMFGISNWECGFFTWEEVEPGLARHEKMLSDYIDRCNAQHAKEGHHE